VRERGSVELKTIPQSEGKFRIALCAHLLEVHAGHDGEVDHTAEVNHIRLRTILCKRSVNMKEMEGENA
jgi:hypothetical protein